MILNLPTAFVKNIYEVYPQEAGAWLTDLPSSLELLCQKWNVQLISLVPQLSYGFVAAVHEGYSNKDLIIKMTPAGGPTVLEAEWLRLFPQISPKIHAVDQDRNAVLMERLQPGTTLKEMSFDDDEGATRVIARVIRKLQERKVLLPPTMPRLKHLSELAPALEILHGFVDPGLLSHVRSLFDKLARPQSSDIVLHGDLHHDNILKTNTDWKVIDPHGYIGDAAFEAAPLFYNPLELMSKKMQSRESMKMVVERRLQILGEELKFDVLHLRDWALCMTVLSMAWTFEGCRVVDENQLMLAEIFKESVR